MFASVVDKNRKPGQIYSGYDEDFFSSILGLPQIVVPSTVLRLSSASVPALTHGIVGQNPFESRISERTEFAPIVGSLTGVRGEKITRQNEERY
jgi:hypothetical protein